MRRTVPFSSRKIVIRKSCIIKFRTGFFCAILILFLLLGVFPIQNTNIVGELPATQADSTKLLRRMNGALQQIHDIKRNDAEMLIRIIGDSNISNPDAATPSALSLLVGDNKDTVAAKDDPTFAYEKMRRQLELDMRELWYSTRGHASRIGRKDFDQIQDIYRLLRSYLSKLRQEDGYEIYRERETKELSRIMQTRILNLQNPTNCSSAKKFVCSLNEGTISKCDFGCQIHHLVYCMAVAYNTSRTLIIESIGWKYNREGWDKVFMPISETCTSSAGSTKAYWGSGFHDAQVLALPTGDSRKKIPTLPYLPIAIPSDIAGRLEKVHGEPHIWWIGQFLSYLFRPQPKTQALLNEAKSKMDIRSPTVGVHIRRTDKLIAEASFHPLKQYMKHVEEYFSIREKSEGLVKKRVFIASDDPNVISQAGRTYNGTEWQIMGDKSVAQSASVRQRYTNKGLLGIVRDVFLLSECDYVVCTFSSNICRVAYELMQAKQADASGRFVSLDDSYYYGVGAGAGTFQTAQFAHEPRSRKEIELAVGDKIGVAGNHWDGMSKGTNQRTKRVGLFPSYKARNPYVNVFH